MSKSGKTISFFFQLFITYAILLTVYMIYALLDMLDFDMIGAIGFFFFQPILAFIISSVTILICLIMGSPIRFNARIRNFWISKPWISIAGIVLGILLLILSFSTLFEQVEFVIIDGNNIERTVPNLSMTIFGWILLAFSLLHFYPHSIVSNINRFLLNRPNHKS